MFLHYFSRKHITTKCVAVTALTALAVFPSSAAPIYGEEGGTLTQQVNFKTKADSIKGFVQFPVNVSWLTKESRIRLDRMAYTIDSLKRSDTLTSIDIYGFSSPDGSLFYNERLARQRARTAGNYLFRNSSSPLDIYTIHSGGEDWNMLRERVAADPGVPERMEILQIIDSDLNPEEKEKKLRALGNGTWRYLSRNIFPLLRRAEITVGWRSHAPLSDTVEFADAETDSMPSSPVVSPAESETLSEETVETVEAVAPTTDTWHRNYHIKTNLLGWPCLWANVEGEADLAPHWSVALSVYYSGWNYFTSTTKFRTFSVMPEIRYWTGRDNDGFFVGAHPALCYYNVALDGANRYQDHDGKTPALGGGLSVGYRVPLRNPRWKLEFSLGGGVYHLDYDIFENRSNGQLLDRRQRTFFGLDKVAVSLCYTFGYIKPSKKGGMR